ncbi:MAG: DUF1553 domain-containing protein [Planctomycetota bacterium]
MQKSNHQAKSTRKATFNAFLFLSLIFASGDSSSAQNTTKIDGDYYRKIIRPILSDKCYTCHGPDEQTREGGFRFDQRDSAFAIADSGATPIAPGSIEKSELLHRIFAKEGDWSKMPPDDQEKQLTLEEKEHLNRWIRGGAPWRNHWAFEWIQRPPVPKSDELIQEFELPENWQNNPIDSFVLRSIKAQSLTPSPPADKPTLIRRLSFDLTGLPPSPSEVKAFLADDSENAYEKVVDRLLNSVHYGEHMASYWLDAARFADTNGYQNDFGRNMWPWRDWVIEAFNNNQPFDQFTIEQLAGDMLPDPTLQQRIATGFNRNNRTVTEGGSIEQEWHVENVIDRVETVSTTFLGLTMGCARCHDHKYDPISQKEFYEFFAYFNSSRDKGFYQERRGNVGPVASVPSALDAQKIEDLESRIETLERNLVKLKDSRPTRIEKWESEFRNSPPLIPTNDMEDFTAECLAFCKSENPSDVTRRMVRNQTVKNRLIDSCFPDSTLENCRPALTFADNDKFPLTLDTDFEFAAQQPFSVTLWVRPKKHGAILSRMDAGNDYRGFDILLTDRGEVNVHLIHQWPVNALKVTTKSTVPIDRWCQIGVVYDGSQKARGLQIYINGLEVSHEVNNDNLNGSTITRHPFWIGRRSYAPSSTGRLTDLRLFDFGLTSADVGFLIETQLRNLVAIGPQQRTKEQANLLSHLFATRISPEESEMRRRIADTQRRLKTVKSEIPTTMVMEELETPRPTFLLNRGLYDQPDKSELLSPGLPAFLPNTESDYPPNRLGLAQWIVDSENPLTARVTVNRFWQNYFGVGLLDTPENFGVQSPLPSHPELLDWLATEFMQTGWDVKAFQKLIVMSQTYQQSSKVTQQMLDEDPKNRWLARGSRFRLSSEAIRDNALAVSGLLTPKIGGPSVKPYQPEGLWQELAGGAGEKPYVQATDGDLYRRSLYIYRKRTVPHPTMSTFDAGSREVCQVARQRTNTPLQALALLNDVTYVEAARALADKVMQQEKDTASQIKLAFLRTVARNPNKMEQDILVNAYQRNLKRFQVRQNNANELLSYGELKKLETIDNSKLAAMTIVCSTILNLDEAVTKE